jgi:uncharacterized protein YcbK (DUF882 family)
MGDLSNNFNRSEFACRCGCGQDTVDAELLEILEAVRERFDSSVIITSGNRCLYHNEREGGSSNSLHLTGRAADFVVVNVDPEDVADFLEPIAPGLGRYSNWTHVDSRSGGKARWSGA